MRIFLFILGFILIAAQGSAQLRTLYDFSAKSIDGKELNFSQFKGKKVIIVNTASECSLAPQFKRLQAIFEEYGGDDFTII
ncbi:MAG: glutathione peroxidase, partial [Mariniphaga sp.]|nr:glutathione peroxidase [Mariniphaga sp.]